MTDVVYKILIDWDNNGSVLAGAPTTGEDVTLDCLGLRTPIDWSYGKDTARSLSDITPGSLSLELDNRLMVYSPDNASGPLFGKLGPGKPIQITATLSGTTYYLFYGFIDDYELDPSASTKSAKLTAFDGPGRASGTKITTGLYSSVRTGDAVNIVLDAIGWPTALRDIDPGATTIAWYWENDTDALDALKAIVESEGGPALVTSTGQGVFTFRDRHHRFIDAKSTTVQASFAGVTTEPVFCEPVTYNIGFKDLINDVSFSVDERSPQPEAVIWSVPDSYSITPGQPLILSVSGSDPFYDAVIPEEGTDYTLNSGDVDIAISTDNGQTITVTVSANTQASITGLQVRAKPVTVARTYVVAAQDSSSISKYGLTSFPNGTPKWVGRNDAAALAAIILAQRSERLPVMSITINSGNDIRKAQILARTLSDRVHITEAYTGVNNDHFVERVEHDIKSTGKDHRITIGCERVRTVTGTQFTFDVAGAGFDQGSFGLPGFDNASTIFILGSGAVGHMLGSGKLAT